MHTLNGSALALPRIVAALLENHQDENGVSFTQAQMPTTDVFLNKIEETLNKWESFGYRYYIREGKCDSKRKRGGRKSRKSKIFNKKRKTRRINRKIKLPYKNQPNIQSI